MFDESLSSALPVSIVARAKSEGEDSASTCVGGLATSSCCVRCSADDVGAR